MTKKSGADKKRKPIGIFDSGLGGLSIAQAVRNILPNEDVVYLADIEYSPYGPKSKTTIAERSERILNFLIEQGCKLIVVACNTATVNSISQLRAACTIPIVGVEPGVKPAALHSESGVIGVLATEQTLKSDSFQRLKASYGNDVRIEERACPDFVTIVESLEHEEQTAAIAAEHYIRPLLDEGCDKIILGCTHFSFLTPAIKQVVEGKADVIDTADAVGKEVQRRLSYHELCSDNNTSGGTTFWTTGDITHTSKSISKLWRQEVSVFQATP